MPTPANILIVDDEFQIRKLMSAILAQAGYRVRAVEDGFAALLAIRSETPDIILSDLNMPRMSGFELLSVVRRRFPSIPVIATSGAFTGNAIPAGIAADAFYEKGVNLFFLLKILQSMARPDRAKNSEHSSALSPIWIQNGEDAKKEADVTIGCPECLRTFPQKLVEERSHIRRTGCFYCGSEIHYAIVPPPFVPKASVAAPRPTGFPEIG